MIRTKTSRIAVLAISTLIAAAGVIFAESTNDLRDAIVTKAESYLGAPYVYGGDTADGFDCSGLAYRVYRDSVDRIIPRTTEEQFKDGTALRSAQVEPGDLLFFDTEGSRVSHVAIYLGDGKFVHAASDGPDTGVIISSFSDDYYRNRYVGARAFLPEPAATNVASGGGSIGSPETDATTQSGTAVRAGAAVTAPARSGADTSAAPEGIAPALLAPPGSSDHSPAAAAFAHLASIFQGKFLMSFGSMQLRVSDEQGDVQGIFVSSGHSGWIIGKIDPVSGLLRADWVIPETATHYRTSGQIVFSPSENGRKLVGSWRYDGASQWQDTWVAVSQQ